MYTTAWILLFFFGFVSLTYLIQSIFGRGVQGTNIGIWFFSVIVTALSAGVIWGGLFQ